MKFFIGFPASRGPNSSPAPHCTFVSLSSSWVSFSDVCLSTSFVSSPSLSLPVPSAPGGQGACLFACWSLVSSSYCCYFCFCVRVCDGSWYPIWSPGLLRGCFLAGWVAVATVVGAACPPFYSYLLVAYADTSPSPLLPVFASAFLSGPQAPVGPSLVPAWMSAPPLASSVPSLPLRASPVPVHPSVPSLGATAPSVPGVSSDVPSPPLHAGWEY